MDERTERAIEIENRITFVNMISRAGLVGLSGEIANFLQEEGFFIAPASIGYHGDYPGGLFDHSVKVTRCLIDLTNSLNLKWKNDRSPIIVGMFHDLCKAVNYKREVEQVGSTSRVSGEWKKVKNDVWGTGHGSKSVAVASTLLKLTDEEVMCIRYHMGAYETDEWANYDAAIRRYPNVLFTHTADMMASKIHNV